MLGPSEGGLGGQDALDGFPASGRNAYPFRARAFFAGGHQLRSSQRYRNRGKLFPSHAHFALMANNQEVDSRTLAEALEGVEKVRWEAACKSELDSLTTNNTSVSEPLPLLRTAIGFGRLFRKTDDGRFTGQACSERIWPEVWHRL